MAAPPPLSEERRMVEPQIPDELNHKHYVSLTESNDIRGERIHELEAALLEIKTYPPGPLTEWGPTIETMKHIARKALK